MSMQPDPQWEELPASTPESLTVKFRQDQLTDAGAFVLNAVRGQSPHLARLLEERGGVIYADLYDSDPMGSDDVVFVQVRSTLSYRDRALKHGIEGLDRADWSGQIGPQGHPIPTPEYLDHIEAFYGDSLNRMQPHRFEVPETVLRRIRRGGGGAGAWNAFADAVMSYCQRGDFEVVVSDDWITQTEAAQLTGASLAAVRTAVQKGKLRTWEDRSEPNPQRRTRVSRSDALRLWGGEA